MPEVLRGHGATVLILDAESGAIVDANEAAVRFYGWSRDELLAKLMGTMQAPVATFVRTLNEVPARFVRTLAAVRDGKGGGEGEGEAAA